MFTLLRAVLMLILLVVTEHIRHIVDPEHPLTLEQLAVVSAGQVEVNGNHVLVEFTPTVPHCGASTLIGKYHANHPSCYLLTQ